MSPARPPRALDLSTIAVIGLLLVGLLGPALAPFHYADLDLQARLEGPSGRHLLGQDELGRDVLSRLLVGARISLSVAFSVVAGAGLIGTLLGLLSGWYGGLVDRVLMRLLELVMAFPGILLAIALVAVLGPALQHLVLALVVSSWPPYARLVRARVLELRERDFVAALRAAGLGTPRILFGHVLPATLGLVAIQAGVGLGGAILAEAGLSFLGLGIQPPLPSWGSMIDAGREHLLDAPHLCIVPGLAIALTVICLNLWVDRWASRLEGSPQGARPTPV